MLLREVMLEGYLVNETPLRIGVGREAPLGSAVDLAVIRIKLGKKTVPYIPGSSLKGVFRSAAVQLAKLKGLSVCSGLSKETCMDLERQELGGETLHERIQSLLREGHNLEAIKLFHEKTCLLCKVFGAPLFTGHIEFTDAYPINEKGEPLDVFVGVRTGIAINRRTGAVHRGALYQVEYVEPGARFKFSLHTTNLPNYALGLLAKTLKMLNEGWVKIGGFKTRGFGEVRVEALSFAARGATVKDLKLFALDELDNEVNLEGLVEASEGWLKASGNRAWEVLTKLEKVWEGAKLS
ncbi:MAG: CRISPR-associated RAMP protein [Candidatus Verstraetearchaeota archaeon]|nr:CRISPR-associated RAMP protein [Candidatus Verstraetearchaeota archaeon]